MRVFDTNVQKVKYRVLTALIRQIYDDKKDTVYLDLPKKIAPGPKPEVRCCIYKERAIVQERLRVAMGGNPAISGAVEVLDIACDECPIGGIYVTPACRGCLVHKCVEECPKNAITIVDHHAVVDKSKCVECGKCTKVCPYGAIIAQHRPCVQSCKVKAISMNEDKTAKIDYNKCVSCGACVYQCPFGAIVDKSLVLNVIDLLRGSENNTRYRVYAVIAPAIVSQFKYARIEQVVTGIEKLGFHHVVEAALGADVVLGKEMQEFQERGLMTTSCCPSFVMLIEKHFPELKPYISHTVSPMVETARMIKSTDPEAKVVFIGPCSSKKLEYALEKTGGAIDSVLSFEELQAFIDARDIDISTLEDTALDNASFYGRIFAKSGGITQGVKDLGGAKGVTKEVKPVVMNGLEQCRMELLKWKMGRPSGNFFEGMACEGGCINGALTLSHSSRNMVDVDAYGAEAKEKDIESSVRMYKSLTSSQDS